MRFAKPFVLSVILAVAMVAGAPARAYENPELSMAAADFRAALIRRHGGRGDSFTASAAWSQANRLFRRRAWYGAIRQYERAAGLGLDDARMWLEFSIALSRNRPPRDRDALAAAWLGYRAAISDRRRATALLFIGVYYERLKQPRPAFDAYAAGLKITKDRKLQSGYDRLAARFFQHLKRSYTEVESDSPRICLEFTRDLPAKGKVDYRDYVVIRPSVKAAFLPSGKNLCIEGVAHGRTYQVTVRAGLPDTSGKKLVKTETFNVAVPDRSETVGFRGSAFILPRASRQGIPLTSVNVTKARLRLLRINDRNLIAQINEGRMRQLLSGYDARRIANLSGEQVWKGELDIRMVKNRQVTTAIPADQLLKAPKPGLYVLIAEPAGKKVASYENRATQWLVISDLGISTFSGAGGMSVFVRSFDSAKSLEGIEVRLIARNNEVLGKATTDAAGRATFAPGLLRGRGGARPAAIMAFAAKGDFNFLDLLRPAFDLSDRGVSGRAAPGPVDAYLYTERGVYRPGEAVHVIALLRDDKARAVGGMPLTVRVFRPDGVEARRYTLPASARAGGYHATIRTTKASRTGRWTARAYLDPKGRPVGQVRFQVEDFVPERLDVRLEAERKTLQPGQPNAVIVDSRFLYGAPAAGLRVEAEIVLKQDMNPYPDFRGYKFGLVQETWRAKREELKPTKTDDQGKARVAIALDGAPETTRPLKAEVRVSVLETGGRAVSRVISVPVRAHDLVLGIKPMAEGETIGEGQRAEFRVVALDRNGKARAADGLIYTLYRVHYRYHWFYRNNRWNYRLIQRDEPVKTGKLSIGADRPAELGFATNWGRYRVEVRDAKSGAAASVRYHVGWFVSAAATQVPDKLSVKLDKDTYKAGETAKVHIRPPFDGRVLLTIAGDRLFETRQIDVPRGGKTVEVTVNDTWGPGVYVTATAYRPMSRSRKRGPARAIGVAYLKRDVSDRILKVGIEAPGKITPRRKVEVVVAVSGARAGRAFVTLAAVDEGILQLTGFKTPAPDGHFFAKRRLAVDIRDDYGRLIDAYAGRLGRLRSGGDAADVMKPAPHTGGLDASSVKTVALFSGIVRVDADGKARITLDVPDFNGRLRLMAVAWTEDAVGKAEGALVVRDPVVSLVTLPRFLAPGDRGRVSVSLHNVDGQAGAYRVRMATAGAAAAIGGRASVLAQLARDGRKALTFALRGRTVGVSKITFSLSGPGGFKITRNWDIAVRAAQAAVTRNVTYRLQPGEQRTYTGALLTGFLPGTAKLYLSFSTYPDLDAPALVRSLDQYPYGCAEQTTSRALPLLYLADVARSVGVAADPRKLRLRIQNAINRVLTMQKRNGGFGLWTANDDTEAWLSAYVLDFLTQAKRRKYLVPDFVLKRGLDRLQAFVNDDQFAAYELPVKIYALYVLALNKRARPADLRYLHDTYLARVPTSLAKAQLGAALALYGDTRRASEAFASARVHSGRPRFTGRYWRAYYRDYGSDLRDLSGVVYLSSLFRTGTASVPGMVQSLNRLRGGLRYTSTQEKAWMLLVVHALSSGDPLRISVAGREVAKRRKPYFVRPSGASLARGVSVRNRGETRIWNGVTVTGVPARDMPPENSGFEIRRSFYTLDGKPADLAKLRQSDVLVAVIRGRRLSGRNHQALVVDLLPAGFEIENARLKDGRSTKDLKWLPKLDSPRHVEPRDDRYVAAIDLSGKNRAFTLAYVVRAVTPGTFRLPAIHVEDMYRPSFFARTAMGRVVITGR